MKTQKTVVFLLFFIIFGVSYSCLDNKKGSVADADDMKEGVMHKMRLLLMTPDSLRSAEDKALLRQIEAEIYEHCIVKSGIFEITISKEQWKSKGLDEIYYDMLIREINDINHFLDTVSAPKPDFEGEWRKSREEYLARKKSQHPE